MKITRREFIKSQAAVVAAATAGVTLPVSITAVAAESDEGVRWDKAPCRFCGTGCLSLIHI